MSRSKCEGSGHEAGTAKKHQVMKMETKVNIIKRVKWGKKIIDKIVTSLSLMNFLTISMILKNKDKIMEHMQAAVPMIFTITSK